MFLSRRRILTAGAVAGLLTVGVAPAQADHEASIRPDGSVCSLGAYGSPVAMHLITDDADDIRLRVRRDRSARYECTFRGVPKFLAADDPRNAWGEDWRLPRRTTVTRHAECWRPGEEATDNNTARGSRIIVRPNGTVTVICHTDGNYYPDPADVAGEADPAAALPV